MPCSLQLYPIFNFVIRAIYDFVNNELRIAGNLLVDFQNTHLS